MMLCIASAGVVTALAISSFTLEWTHSVEQTQWSETWLVTQAGLQLVEASVEGSGAGIDLPDDAVWADGRWSYRPQLAPLQSLSLAASGMTPGGWTLCAEGHDCHVLGSAPEQVVKLWSARDCVG
jgi:hypothetical protein